MVSEAAKRVVVTRSALGFCHMQVCAGAEATDEEILAVCNAENPSGVTPWSEVLREDSTCGGRVFRTAPVLCEDDPARRHFLVSC